MSIELRIPVADPHRGINTLVTVKHLAIEPVIVVTVVLTVNKERLLD
jgi:hypothetical protein